VGTVESRLFRNSLSRVSNWTAHLPLDRALASWLRGGGSLTARLRHRAADFGMRRLAQFTGAALPDEKGSRLLPRQRGAVVREVLLMGGARPLVFAHSVAATSSLNGPWRELRGLGGRPLAELLFADPRARREPLRYALLRVSDPLGRRVRRALPEIAFPLWARRSVFRHRGVPLLVTEVFLPALEDLPPP
jgi:chorismate--pyruvate lyase